MVLLEDRANGQIANGFVQEVNPNRSRQIQILPEAGGWHEVLDKFAKEHVAEMDRLEHRLMVLVLDCDGSVDRLTAARDGIPDRLKNRVFIIGARTQPEELRQDIGISYEKIGEALARDCRDDQADTWGHELLAHNGAEVQRLGQAVRPILFS